jgi:hypothetical protein
LIFVYFASVFLGAQQILFKVSPYTRLILHPTNEIKNGDLAAATTTVQSSPNIHPFNLHYDATTPLNTTFFIRIANILHVVKYECGVGFLRHFL